MLVTSYRALCRMESGDVTRFMMNPGPAIRGALGYCLMEESKERGFDYLRLIFKPRRRIFRSRLMLRKLKHPPPPFTIPPPRVIGKGMLEVGLNFYGEIGLNGDLIVSVMRRLDGRSFTGDVRLKIEEIIVENEVKGKRVKVYDCGNGFVEGRIPAITLEDVDAWVQEILEKKLGDTRIVFLTPFKLLKEGRPLSPEDLRASDLVRYITRRHFLLEYLYNRRRLPWMNPVYVNDLKEWVDENLVLEKCLKISDAKLRGEGGFMEGYIKLGFKNGSRLKEVFRILKIGELIAVGKNTSYGYGHYKLIA